MRRIFRRLWMATILPGLLVPLSSPPVQGQSAPTGPTPAGQVTTLRTLDPHNLQQSRMDRLSGGLNQQIPFRMVTDSRERILVTDPFLSLVHVFDTKAGKRWQINGDHLQRMVFPTYIAVDAEDNIYISEPLRAKVTVFRPDGHFLRSIGSDHLFTPFGLAVDKSSRKLFVADHYRDEIQVYSLDGQFLQTIGSRGTAPGELLDPCDIALHHGVLFVLDRGNSRFQFFDLDGNSKGVWNFGDNQSPIAFAFDPAGNLFAVDTRSLGMLVLDPAGNLLSTFDPVRPYGQPRSTLYAPTVTSVAPSPDGSILALRPALTIDYLKLQSDVPAVADKPPTVQ
ncbi:MAG TPA: 6-bladed beta-propeller [Dongiaceae bacterium]|nr:6-bladed beta-propeller [Dongiaceae bacterium]